MGDSEDSGPDAVNSCLLGILVVRIFADYRDLCICTICIRVYVHIQKGTLRGPHFCAGRTFQGFYTLQCVLMAS